MAQVEELHGEDLASCYLSFGKLLEAVGTGWEKGWTRRKTRGEQTEPRIIIIKKIILR